VNETVKGNRTGAPPTQNLSTKLNRLSETARKNPQYQFSNLAHMIDVEMLNWAFQELRKGASAGVDGLTAKDYEMTLKSNLEDLYKQMKEGKYRAQPLRRTYIEKEDGKQRPLSIPALED